MEHESLMHRCLDLAGHGRGLVGNGAMVGAVLVREGRVIAEGYHGLYGGLHAERTMLESYPGEILPEDILYVNLEPCCHHGKTPPCTDIIIGRNIKSVVYGMADPDVRVAGKGIATLESAGIRVTGPVLHALCGRFNRGFISVRTMMRPWVTLKTAQTKDGRTSQDGAPIKITSREQDTWSHMELRSAHDAVLVGVGTVIADDPLLDARLAAADKRHDPTRIILDPHCRIPLNARVVSDARRTDTIVVHAPIVTREAEEAIGELSKRGVMLREVPIDKDYFNWDALWSALLQPEGEYHGITSILVEGGMKTWEMFRSCGMVDEEVSLIQQ